MLSQHVHLGKSPILGQHIHIGRHAFSTRCTARRRSVVRAQYEDEEETEKKGIFSFVTDNPSSRSAIYQDGANASEVGAVTRRTKDKGQDFGQLWDMRSTGSCADITELTWFIREIGSASSDAQNPPTVFLHGVPSQSYSFVPVLTELERKGWHAYAPDWIGFGFSEQTQPKYGFTYTEAEFHKALNIFLEEMEVARPFNMVAHGFITGQYAATWALANPDAVSKLVLMDMPLNGQAKLPIRLQPLKIPFVGAAACQDALISERTLEGGSPYEMSLDDADIYRFPYLNSSMAGEALCETVKQSDVAKLGSRLQQGLSEAAGWKVPTLLLTGDGDKYIKPDVAEAVAASNPGVVKARVVEAAGHQPQEDYPTQVVDMLVSFLR